MARKELAEKVAGEAIFEEQIYFCQFLFNFKNDSSIKNTLNFFHNHQLIAKKLHISPLNSTINSK